MSSATRIHHVTHDVAKLTNKAEFIDELYELHSRVFDGVSKEKFVSYVVDPPAEKTRIRIFSNEAGELIGYCAVHLYKVTLRQKQLLVIRAESGLLPEYRGHNMTLIFGYEEAFRYRLLHPLASMYYLGSFVHPGVFHMFGRFFKTMYPHYQYPTPEATEVLMLELADRFAIPAVSEETPMVREVGWITRESPDETARWQQDNDPWVKYYIKNNPGYAKGNGLVVLVPLSLANMTRSLGRYLARRSLHHRPGHDRSQK